MRRLLLLSLAFLALPACDSSTYDNGYDDGYYDGQGSGTTTAGARFVDFSLDARRYTVSSDTRTASYESDNIDSGTIRAAVERALIRGGEGDAVMLYIKSYLVSNQASPANLVYSALPISRAFDQVVLTTGPMPGSTTTINVVGYTASYEFSFGNDNLYFDVVSSARASDFSTNPATLFDFIIPQRLDAAGVRQGADRLEFRLVTVPATAARGGTTVDMTDYAAVKAAYGLPD